MGFRIGDINEVRDNGILNGIQHDIACDCWFTSGGRTIPRIIKVIDDEAMIYTIDDIRVLYSEEKNYSGIETIEHVCRIRLRGQEDVVKIIYRKDKCLWSIINA